MAKLSRYFVTLNAGNQSVNEMSAKSVMCTDVALQET